MRIFYVIFALSLSLFLAGVAGCPPKVDPDPDYTPPPAAEFNLDDFLAIMELADDGVALGHHFAIKDQEGPACLGTDIGMTNTGQILVWAPVIDAEMQAPDGTIDLPGFRFDASECLPFFEVWPPVEPNPDVATEIDLYFGMGMNAAITLVQLSAPSVGQECVDAQIALAILRAVNELEPQVTDEILVSADLIIDVPPFSADYSMCDLSEPAPAADDDSSALQIMRSPLFMDDDGAALFMDDDASAIFFGEAPADA